VDKYIVVSSDCHAGLPPEKYRDYLDPKFHETFDLALPIQLERTQQAEESFLIKDINDAWRGENAGLLPGAWDYDTRIKILDNDGITAEVIFADGVTERNAPPFGAGLGLPTKDIVPELQWAGAHAHNRWLAELCSNAPERHVGVALVPLLWDIERAVEEVKWCAENGLKGVMIPIMTHEFEGYHHTRYHPFWEACEALEIIVHFHSGGSNTHQYFGDNWPAESADEFVGGMGVYVTEAMFWTYRPITFMIWGGVFEKFPKLKTVVTEAGTAWVIPTMLRTLDHNYFDVHFSRKLGDFRSHLSMSPQEYFRRNVGIGASCMPRPDIEVRHQIGLDQIMWGSDYPHPEGTWPQTDQQMFDTFHDLPEDETAAMLGGNAIRFYGLDGEKLKTIAERIGPDKQRFVTAA
jgi:predicted TIM-barrel fold metal-dependent hydrolase